MNELKGEKFFRAALRHSKQNQPEELERFRIMSPNHFQRLKEKEFFGDYVFVVYAAGFNWKTNVKQYPRLEKAFKGFDIDEVSKMKSLSPVFAVNRHRTKAESVIRGAKIISKEGFENFKKRIGEQGPEALSALPGIGPTTKDHLARNIGLADVSKNDVWIKRLVTLFGAKTHTELVDYLAKRFGEKRGVVDVVLWRFCRDNEWKRLGKTTLEDFVQAL